MVIRAISGDGSESRRRQLFPAAAFAVALTVTVAAQEPQPTTITAETPPASAPAPAPAAPPQLGRVLTEKVALRCWPGTAAQPPVFEDVLEKDQVVMLGRTENGFRAVVLPLGPVGYVSRKFSEAASDGTVKTKGTKVAFRYRPRSSEAPVAQLEDHTVLHVVSEEPDWYRVRVPSVEAWVPEADVQIGDQADQALAASYAEWKAKQEAEVQARLDTIAAAKKQEVQNQADLAALKLVEDAFTAELAKPIKEQSYDPLNQALETLVGTLAAESAAKPQAETLKKRIETQRWIAEATIVRDAKPEPVAALPPEPKDDLEKFQSIGWLRYERRLGGPGVYYLEKGDRRQCLVSCNTGRYDLSLFVDREVGLMGPRRRPAAESLSVLDAERLEVLGTIPQ